MYHFPRWIAAPLWVGDLLVLVKWHVEVDANQHSLVLHIHIFNAEFRAKRHVGRMYYSVLAIDPVDKWKFEMMGDKKVQNKLKNIRSISGCLNCEIF